MIFIVVLCIVLQIMSTIYIYIYIILPHCFLVVVVVFLIGGWVYLKCNS